MSGTIVYGGHTEGAPPMRVGGRSRTGASTKCGNSWLSETLTGTWAVQFVFEPISPEFKPPGSWSLLLSWLYPGAPAFIPRQGLARLPPGRPWPPRWE